MEDLVTGLFGPTASFSRLGRSPSEAEFAAFLSMGALPEGEGAGLHRVASIDLLRRMILNQQVRERTTRLLRARPTRLTH